MSVGVFPEQMVQRIQAPEIPPQLAVMSFGGLTKRELFAAMCLHGIMTANVAVRGHDAETVMKAHACAALMFADALIEALAKEKA